MALMRLKGVPPDAILVQRCVNDFCNRLTLHGPVRRLKLAWVTGKEGKSVFPVVGCDGCGEQMRIEFELEPIGS